MDWETLIIIVSQIVISLALYFLIKSYFPAYFSEKGKNLATKEDIEEITEKIKTVESKINIRASGEIDYNSLKRKIILEYFGAYNHWETMLLTSHSYYDDDAESKNTDLINKLAEAKFNFNLKEGEAELFIGGMEFIEIRQKLNPTILQLQHDFESHCSEISFIVKSGPIVLNRYQKVSIERDIFYPKRMDALTKLIPIKDSLVVYLEKILKQSFN